VKRSEYNRKCFLCDSDLRTKSETISDVRFGVRENWTIGQCLDCGITQTFPVPSFEDLRRYYKKYYNFHGKREANYAAFRQQFLSSKFYRAWLTIDGDISFHNLHGSGRLLDVGCNEGRGLMLYRKNGFEVEGLELNLRAAAEAKKKGFKVFTKSIEDYYPINLVDVVVVSNVLEHSLNPRKMLNQISRVINKDGQVWISCPNLHSWQRHFFGRYWINWHVPFHIFHFSKKTLSKLLKETGFKIVEQKQKSPSLWIAQSVIALIFSKPGHATTQMRKPFLVAFLMLFMRFFLFPLLWVGNLLGRGDCLLVVAKKV